MPTAIPIPRYEVAIVGGSYAGLSAAMTLGRALRRTLVIDAGKPANRFTPQAHNLLTHDGAPPHEIARAARTQVERYPTVSFVDGYAAAAAATPDGFAISLSDGRSFAAGKLLLAMGVNDLLLDTPGYRACWGNSVIHCPYCHGYEYRGRPTGILVNDDSAGGFAALIRNWTSDLTILTDGEPLFSVEPLAATGVRIASGEIAAFEHEHGVLQRVRFADGSALALAAVYHRPAFELVGTLAAELGCEFGDTGHLAVDGLQQTSAAGVYAAGDCTTPLRSLSNAMAQGTKAGAMINHELLSLGR